MDYTAQQLSLARQRKLADMLRAKAEATSNYQERPGQMVSGHYVAPSWSQNLSSIINPMMQRQRATAEEDKAAQQEGVYNQAVDAARQKWQSALPQAVAAKAEQQGPVDPANPTELNAAPAQPVTTGRILQHTLAGLDIPGNERAAGVYNQGALADLAREDTQAARKEDLAANNAAKLVQAQEQRAARLEEIRVRNEDRGLDRASREQMAREARALTAQIAQGNQELRRLAIEAKRDADADRKAAAGEKAKVTTEGEKSSAGYLNRMKEAEARMLKIGNKGNTTLLQKTVGGIPMVGDTLRPFVSDEDQQQLRQSQEDWVRAKLRKESGAVIGAEEMAREITQYFRQPGEAPSLTKQKEESRQAALRQLEITSGRELANANMGSRGAPQTAPTQAEVDKMPRGTRFIGSDGKEYVKD
jgi:hypothetical protein